MSSPTVAFIGLGLIGGSVARALKQADPGTLVKAYDKDPDTLNEASRDGVVDVILDGIDSRLSDCDWIFLCAPVKANMELAERIRPLMGENTVLTDVGSVKTGMHRKIEELGLGSRFIGGHPMAGSERTGYRNSKAGLLENAYYIITTTEETPRDTIERYEGLVRSMRAIPLVMDCAQHDRVTAAVSHVPHVISASLVNLVKDSDDEAGDMRTVAAGGFKDITRISSSSSDMWQGICLANPENISRLLGDYIASLEKVKGEIESGDGKALKEFFESARQYRDTFPGTSSGPIKTDNAIHVQIPDRNGALAEVIDALAHASIGIKNVGIVHNREYEYGSLRVELYLEEDVPKAAGLLRKGGWDVTVG